MDIEAIFLIFAAVVLIGNAVYRDRKKEAEKQQLQEEAERAERIERMRLKRAKLKARAADPPADNEAAHQEKS